MGGGTWGSPNRSRKTAIFIAAAFTLGVVVSSFILGLAFYNSRADLLGSTVPLTSVFGSNELDEIAAEAIDRSEQRPS